MFQHIHVTVEKESLEYKERLRRYNYVTPTSYLELLQVFKRLLKEKRASVGGLKTKLENGLSKLQSAALQVAQLQIDLREKQPVLVQTQKDVSEMMVQIEEDTKQVRVIGLRPQLIHHPKPPTQHNSSQHKTQPLGLCGQTTSGAARSRCLC